MAYDGSKPANDEFLADFPPEMREQLRAIVQDQIVNALRLCGLSPGNGNGNIPVSNGNLNTNLNAEKLGGQYSSAFAATGHGHSVATGSSNGFMSNSDKAKMDTIATSAEVNQNAFSNVSVNGSVIQADNKTDTLTLEAGANITLTPDVTNDKVNIAVTGTVPNAGAVNGHIFNWSGQGGQPTWLWGGNDGSNMYVYNPLNFSVSYAGNAGVVSKYGLGIQNNLFANANSILNTGFYYCTNGLPSGVSDANVYHHAYSDTYAHQMAFEFGPNYGNKIYSRIKNNGTWSAWKQLATTDAVLPLTGGTMTGELTVPTIHTGNWFRSTGNTGWYNETYAGGWHMSDATWIRAYNGKNVYTTGVFQADGGFNGALHGTAELANLLNPLTGDSNYKLGYTADGQRTNAGEWGRVVMRYVPNGQTYGVRCDRADSADVVGGYTVAQLIAAAGGIVASSLGENGYIKFACGLILQWGQGATSNGWNTITSFSILFPNKCAAVNITMFNVNGTATGGMYQDSVGVKYKTNRGFYGGSGNISSTWTWIAIGN